MMLEHTRQKAEGGEGWYGTSGARYPEMHRLEPEEWALIERLRELRFKPSHWLIETVAWLVETNRMATAEKPKQWLLTFTGVMGPVFDECIRRGRR